MSAHPTKILTIEDDDSLRRIVAAYLRKRGYHVLEAEDGQAGLQKFRDEHPDVVLLDLRLPDIDGLELLPVFAEKSPQTPILVVSGTGVMADVVEAMRLGAWDFLLKPIADFDELRNAIERSRRRAISAFASNGSLNLQEKEQKARGDRFEAAVDSLRRSESLLKSLVDNSTSAIFVKDTAGRYCMVNRKFEEYLSLDTDETLGKTDVEVLGDEIAEYTMRNDRRVIENGEIVQCDEQVVLQGKLHTFFSTKYPMRDEEGNIIGLGAIATDISDRKRVEEELLQYREHLEELVAERTRELAEANEKLQEDIRRRQKAEKALSQANKELQVIYDGTADGLLVADIETKKFLRANPVICQTLGYSKEELLAMDVYDLRLPEAKDDVEAIFRELATQQRDTLEELPMRRKDGSIIYVDMAVRPIVYHGRPCLMALIRDTTERKQTQQKFAHYTRALEKTNRSLEEANRQVLEEKRSKELLMAMMSHELRTPLHGILSYASFGLKNSEDEEQKKSRRFFEKIGHSGHELLDMVDDILELAKLESGKDELSPSSTDMTGLVMHEVASLSLPASARHISIDCPPSAQEHFTANVDSGKITHVVRNLISNAIKHSPDGGTISVRIEHDKNHFNVAVADEGEGIPDDELEIIFNSFSQSRNKRTGGTGLGLAICREIVSAHNGRIWAENIPNGGAIFTFQIPLNPFGQEKSEQKTISATTS